MAATILARSRSHARVAPLILVVNADEAADEGAMVGLPLHPEGLVVGVAQAEQMVIAQAFLPWQQPLDGSDAQFAQLPRTSEARAGPLADSAISPRNPRNAGSSQLARLTSR